MSRFAPESDVAADFLVRMLLFRVNQILGRENRIRRPGLTAKSASFSQYILNGPAMVDGVQVAFPHDHELVFERLLFRNALCPECLVLDFQQVLYSGVFVHCCN